MQGDHAEARRRGRPKKGREYDADQLFTAAVACFAEFGFEKSSLRMIADQAGVDVALISYRYGSKLGLWAAVVDDVADDTMRQLTACRDASQNLAAEEKIDRLCFDLVETIARRPLFSQLLINEVMTNADSERKDIIEHKIALPINTFLVDYLAEIQPAETPAHDRHSLNVISAICLAGVMITTQKFSGRFVEAARNFDRLKAELVGLTKRILM